ncbi:MAG: DUF6502 family protein [Steroidobacteraceae bacterium]|jgi:hypothetical protein
MERTALLESIEELLRPLMRTVLNFGLNQADLADVVRGLYISAVRDQLVEQGRPVTVARLALMAGVTRGEAENIVGNRKRRRMARVENTTRVDQLVRLLTLWHDDNRFSTPYGAPLDLSLAPERAFKTFDALIAAATIELDREAVLDELVAAGCIEIHEDKFVRCVNRAFIPTGVDVSRISRLGRFVGALNSTFAHNLLRTSEQPSYFERVFVSESLVSQEYRNQLLGYLRDEGQQFLDKLCRWSNEKEESLKDENGRRYGVGLYFYEENKSSASAHEGEGESVDLVGTAS